MASEIKNIKQILFIVVLSCIFTAGFSQTTLPVEPPAIAKTITGTVSAANCNATVKLSMPCVLTPVAGCTVWVYTRFAVQPILFADTAPGIAYPEPVAQY